MVFVSKNILRKCKYCENEPKRNLSSGRNHGYYLTCGSKECLRKQYDDLYVCIKKGRSKNPTNMKCAICSMPFFKKTNNHKRYCLECVPDRSWRGRAQRYGIGKKQWDELLKIQNYTCALCNRIPEVVDHNHKTGVVRGLLCNKCNMRLTILEEDEKYLERAFKYLGRKGYV